MAKAYRLVQAGANLGTSLGRDYLLSSRVSMIGVGDGGDGVLRGTGKFDGGIGYALTLSTRRSKLSWLRLYASRNIGLPMLPHQPGLAYVTSPFGIDLARVALRATASEQVGALIDRNFTNVGVRLRGGLSYKYRIREVSGLYDLQRRTQIVNTAGQRQASGLATNLGANFSSLRLRTTGSLRVSYNNTRAGSNLVDVGSDLRTQVFGAEGLVNLPRLGRLITAVSSDYALTRVSGGLRLRQERSRVGLDARYELGHWAAFAKTGVGFARADENRYRTFQYAETELWYTLRRGDRTSPEFGLQGYGLLRPDRLQEVSYEQPFVVTSGVEGLPMVVVAVVRVPFGG